MSLPRPLLHYMSQQAFSDDFTETNRNRIADQTSNWFELRQAVVSKETVSTREGLKKGGLS